MVTTLFTPELLSKETIGLLRNESATAEDRGELTSLQLQIIHEKKWFLLFVPPSYGGLSYSLPDAVNLEEEIAWADGSVGWVVTLCAGAGLFSGYLDEAANRKIFSHPRVCLAGSGQTSGRFAESGNNVLVNGNWPYASGAAHATHFTANVVEQESGRVRSIVVPRDKVNMGKNWNHMGLRASSTNPFSINNALVPSEFLFDIDAKNVKIQDPVYRFPFLTLAYVTLAANVCGVCFHFFEEAKILLKEKERDELPNNTDNAFKLQHLEYCVAESRSLRQGFYDKLHQCWDEHLHGGCSIINLEQLNKASLHLSQQLRRFVNEIFSHCGLTAARFDTNINRIWRDVNTAAQHGLLGRET